MFYFADEWAKGDQPLQKGRNIQKLREEGEKDMSLTTLCYVEQDDKYLMLHRIKKQHDINKEKWIGIGGHF